MVALPVYVVICGVWVLSHSPRFHGDFVVSLGPRLLGVLALDIVRDVCTLCTEVRYSRFVASRRPWVCARFSALQCPLVGGPQTRRGPCAWTCCLRSVSSIHLLVIQYTRFSA